VPGVARPLFAQQYARVAPAEILIVHAKVYTLDPQKPWAQAIAIRHGKIQAVGRDEEVERYRGIGTKRIDGGGKLVLPGFTDCHIHFLDGSLAASIWRVRKIPPLFPRLGLEEHLRGGRSQCLW
jgi:predicted amidohydrolase YtcJ